MGDSGGPVARFDGRRYVLVGIIERASNPHPTKACGHLTHYVSVGGYGGWTDAAATASPEGTRMPRRAKTRRRTR